MIQKKIIPVPVITCPVLSNPTFGMVELTGTVVQSKALYSCLREYRIVGGDQERECLLTGRWSGMQPTCVG